MNITRRSPLTGELNTLDLPVTAAQFAAWQGGTLIQHAFPHLSANEREFIKTGIYPGEWDAFLGPEEPDDVEG